MDDAREQPGRMDPGSAASRWLPLLLFAAVHLGLAAVFLLDRAPGTDAALTGLPVDDSWIHLVYARSVARLQGFAYNPGQPEAGFTSPLWVLLLAPTLWLSALGLPLIALVKALGLLLGFACSALAFALVRRLTDSFRAGLAAGLLIAVDPWLAFGRLSGMEVPLASAAVLWTLLELSRERPGRASLGLALCGLARPENAVFALPALGLLSWLQLRRGRGLRGALAGLAPSAIAAGAWMAFCLAVDGRPLPNTFYAKHSHKGAEVWLENLRKLFGPMLADLPWFKLWVGVPLFALGAFLLLRRGSRKAPVDLALRWLVVALPLVFLLAVVWAHVIGDENAFYWSRYFHPAIPLLLLPIGAAMAFSFEGAARALRERGRAPAGRVALLLLLAAGSLVPLATLPGRLRQKADLFAWNCQNINEMQVALGHWVAAHTGPGEWIALNDSGAIRFVSDRPAVDLTGLNHHEVLFGHRREVLSRLKPRYLIVFPAWFPNQLEQLGREVYRVRASRYTICDCEQEELVVLEASSARSPGSSRRTPAAASASSAPP